MSNPVTPSQPITQSWGSYIRGTLFGTLENWKLHVLSAGSVYYVAQSIFFLIGGYWITSILSFATAVLLVSIRREMINFIDYRKETGILRKINKDLQNKLLFYQELNDQHQKNNLEQKKEVTKLTRSNTEYVLENKKHQREVKKLTVEVTQHKLNNEQQKQMNEELSQKISALEQQKQQYEEQNKRYLSQIAQHIQANATHQQNNEQQKEISESFISTRKKLDEGTTTLLQDLTALIEQGATANQETIQTMMDVKTFIQNEITEERSKLNQLKEEVNHLNSVRVQLEETTNQATSTVEQANTAVAKIVQLLTVGEGLKNFFLGSADIVRGKLTANGTIAALVFCSAAVGLNFFLQQNSAS